MKAANMALRCAVILPAADVAEADEEGDGAECVEDGVERGEEA